MYSSPGFNQYLLMLMANLVHAHFHPFPTLHCFEANPKHFFHLSDLQTSQQVSLKDKKPLVFF